MPQALAWNCESVFTFLLTLDLEQKLNFLFDKNYENKSQHRAFAMASVGDERNGRILECRKYRAQQ